MGILTEINIVCFTASYAVCLALEISRLFFRAPVRMLVILAFAAAGLLAHSLYLYQQAHREVASGIGAPLSSWYDWCLLAAWIVAGAYLGLALRRPENALGIFLLPMVLALIGIAAILRHAPPFSKTAALGYWRWIHGGALLLGTAAVALGFATGMMYLIQSYRLKHKLPPRPGLRLPSLEWLQRFNREAILISTSMLFLGLISGIVMNLTKSPNSVPWTDPVVISSGVLFLWLTAASVFELLYRPAWQGHKVAYLTLASFVFLVLVMVFVLFGEHGAHDKRPQQSAYASSTTGLFKASNKVPG